MSLRTRLVLTLVAVAVPLVALSTWTRGVLDHRAEVESLYRFILGRMEDGRAACEADPEHFPPPPRVGRRGPREGPDPARRNPRGEPGPPRPGGPGPSRNPSGQPPPPPADASGGPIQLFAYGPDFVSANPRAPAFPRELRRALEQGALRADEKSVAGLHVAARMAWSDGPCAIVMATRPSSAPRWLTSNQVLTASVLALCLAGAVFLAAGPIVGRVRRLTNEVRASARSRYAIPVSVTGQDELAQLAREFNAAGAEIERQFRTVEDRERALRSFVADTTHDVMIPMTVLQGHLCALRDAPGAPAPGVLHDAMEEVQYMTSLLQNLSASAKLEAGEPAIVFSAVDLNALLERVTARHAPIGAQKGIEINYAAPEDPVVIQADLTLLEQAVSNLVHNAVRYGSPNGHVAILLDVPGPGAWRLRVIDDGPGIEPDELEQLTQRAFRSDAARSRHPEGQGLAIALEVARRHGFTLTLRRSEYGGLEAELQSAPA